MQKVIRDGKVAVLYSPGYGAGWSTWNSECKELLLFHPSLVEMVETGRASEINEEFLANLGVPEFYCGGADQLRIEWMPVGTPFYVSEYDGSESIIYGNDSFTIA